MIDIYRSRNGKFRECYYWKRDVTQYGDNNKLVHETNPTGCFYAKLVQDNSKTNQEIGNVFQYGDVEKTIETEDRVNIAPNDIVKMDNAVWLVISVNEREIEVNREFNNEPSKKTTMRIKKNV